MVLRLVFSLIKTIHITANTTDKDVTFSFKDNGIGIKKEYHKQIFEVSDVDIDLENKTITAVGLGLQSRAVYRSKRLGCQLVQ